MDVLECHQSDSYYKKTYLKREQFPSNPKKLNGSGTRDNQDEILGSREA